MEPICYIVGAMEPGRVVFSPRRPGLVIAADAGLAHLERRGIAPDVIVGDFDSLDYVPHGGNVIRHPVEKDDTDMMLAVKTGLERGCREFVLYGGLGGRLDHTYANLQTLVYLAQQGAAGYLVGGGMAASAVKNGSMRFSAQHRGTISVFCPGETARGVDLTGLYYPLRNADLTSGFPLGVSNQFTGEEAAVSVREGTLLVMWEELPEALLERLGGSGG